MNTILVVNKIKYTFIVFSFSFLLININSYPQDKSKQNNHNMNDSTLMHRQHMIHMESPMVMPFNMNKVTHYFIKNNKGGILMIKTKDINDTTQAKLVQKHLKKECKLFSQADFRDPKSLHGKNMPGLKILSASKDKFIVEYKKLSNGAQLTFSSKEAEIIDAIHKWFDAQLKDHGTDAKSSLN